MTELLTSLLHAGYIEYLPWDVSIRRGQHQGLNTFETC